jgi:hypothetical protein
MSADDEIGQNLIINGRLQRVIDADLVQFYYYGYAEGLKGAVEDAAEKLIKEAHHRHVDLSDMQQVLRVEKYIKGLSDK